jgi:hypothetical protein
MDNYIEADDIEEAFRIMKTSDLVAMGLIGEDVINQMFDAQLILIADPTPQDFKA